jgi:hypothetical protein
MGCVEALSMSLVAVPECEPAKSDKELAAEVELILSAMEAGLKHDDRRRHPRLRYRVEADLRLFSDADGAGAWKLYTRDVSARGLGFITRERLPLGYGGIVEMPGPTGRQISINVTLFRCREIGNGWFEGALYFNREQWMFAAAVE